METKQTSLWNSKKQVKKGNIGEQIDKAYLENNGLIVYKPLTDGSHPFDNLCANDREIFIVEVKTKEARAYYPDTGINIQHFNRYMEVKKKHNIKIYLFFVDAANAKIYGEELDNLIKPVKVKGNQYPLNQNEIIYFPLENMKIIAELSQAQCNLIKVYNTKNYIGASKF